MSLINNFPERKRAIPLGRGEIPINLFPSFFYKSRSSSNNFLWASFDIFGTFFLGATIYEKSLTECSVRDFGGEDENRMRVILAIRQ